MQEKQVHNFILIGLFNLVLVALLGTLMRYKIAFDFPLLDQKNTQESHSHFAFAGWISHMLYTLYYYFTGNAEKGRVNRKYSLYIIVNLVASYGMLVSFILTGYSVYSIILSTITIVVAVLLTIEFAKDIKTSPALKPVKHWLMAGLLCHLFSSLGPLYLGYMMVSKDVVEQFYLGSVYFLLHFEYNGWYFFSCMGLAILLMAKITGHLFNFKREFLMLAISVLPAYFLSTLWAKLPSWLFIVTAIAAVVQLIAWGMILFKVWRVRMQLTWNAPPILKWLLLIVTAALTLKFILQVISTHPEISKLVFGFRSIVIAYLHLILLAIVSLFLLIFINAYPLVKTGKNGFAALLFFTVAIFLNELILTIQGIASFAYIPVPYANESLFVVALMLLGGAIAMYIENKKNSLSIQASYRTL